MTAADYFVDYMISKGVTDAFGIPGGVVLELIYAMDRRKDELAPHLTYHEQGASFAACGYAQATGKLGVTYATRGPGFTNMLTAMAEAYYDSIPVLFLTAHDSGGRKPGMRTLNNQEMDTIPMVMGITKYAARVDSEEDIPAELARAYDAAMTGRKGPVFLDFYAPALRKEIEAPLEYGHNEKRGANNALAVADEIERHLAGAKRPVILIGNGVKQSCTETLVERLAERAKIPVLSSRIAQDAMQRSPFYFGFIGSHALRHSAFILSKTDLIIALGNRLAFPVDSQSFRPIVENAVMLRVETDKPEFLREIPNSVPLEADLEDVLPALLNKKLHYNGANDWLAVCNELKAELRRWDGDSLSETIMAILSHFGNESPIVVDVGNHGFWVSNACAYQEAGNPLLYSNSFSALGLALPKAIGAWYGTRCPVLCFVGDQGLQFNIQELQYVSQHRLPITIVVLNNHSSGMIRKREKELYGTHFVHTTEDSGFTMPSLKAIANAYGIGYQRVMDVADVGRVVFGTEPCLAEIEVEETKDLLPVLPKGNACQNLLPPLPEELYRRLNSL